MKWFRGSCVVVFPMGASGVVCKLNSVVVPKREQKRNVLRQWFYEIQRDAAF
jgi:hypothetical protein